MFPWADVAKLASPYAVIVALLWILYALIQGIFQFQKTLVELAEAVKGMGLLLQETRSRETSDVAKLLARLDAKLSFIPQDDLYKRLRGLVEGAEPGEDA